MRYESIFISPTYEGCIDGVMPPSILTIVARTKAKELFGDLPVLVINIKKLDANGMLPKFRYIALLKSDAMDKTNDGSQLILISFKDEWAVGLGDPLLSQEDWNSYAKDFNY